MTGMTVLKENTIIITLNGDNFVVENVDTGEKREIQTLGLLGTVFKSETAFNRAFQSVFGNNKNILIHPTAYKKVQELVQFNRDDN